MSAIIPNSHRHLLDGPYLATLATVMPDGQPQLSVIWTKTSGEYVLVNTIRGRQKERNIVEREMVTVLAVDPDNPYCYIEVRGRVVKMTEEDGVDVINQLAELYTGDGNYYGGFRSKERAQQEQRVTAWIKPEKVNAIG